MLAALALVAVGLVLLFFGAEGLVRGSASLATRLGVGPLAIGLTVVAYGTSMPEMVVSAQGALAGQGDIAIGNAIGSNIFNIALILGLTALICPLKVKLRVVKVDMPVAIAAAALFVFCFRDGVLSRAEGAVLVALLLGYTALNFVLARREPAEAAEVAEEETPAKLKHPLLDLACILVGLALLVGGAKLLVDGSVRLARLAGISEAVIGLTIISAGTSLPELAASAVAAWRKHPDIALGNIVGSNIFNIFCVLGVSACLAPIAGSGIAFIDQIVMLGVSLALLPLLYTGMELRRWEGGVLLASYCAYLCHLLWR